MQLLHTKGYSLVEVLVAISVLLLALVGPLTIAAKSLQSASYATEQTTAMFLAQEGVEVVVAMRNDAFIKEIKSVGGDLANAWLWTDTAKLSPCFAASGCNFEVDYTVGGSVLSHAPPGFIVRNCSTLSLCLLSFDSGVNDRSRYGFSGTQTPYTRVIKLTKDANDAVYIESTVSWSTRVFQGNTQSVTLNSAVYRIYE